MSYPAVILGALIAGALLGLIPGIIGYKKEKQGLAIGGFIACVVGSFLLGLYLSVPICIIFTVIILLSSKKAVQPSSGSAAATYTHSPEPGAGRCIKCDAPLSPGQTFCTSCGARQTEPPKSNCCPSCGGEVPSDMTFCAKCGARVR